MRALRKTDRRRSGAAAIEFAFVFPFFFLLLYGFVNYGLILALQQSMVVAAEDGARAAVACDPAEEEHTSCVETRAREAAGVALAWLPKQQRELILGDDNESVDVVVVDDAEDPVVEVRVEYPDYATQPILPVMKMPMIGGSLPPVPSRLVAQSVVRL